MASIKRRTDGVWRARYRDEAGKEHARHFDRKADATRWLSEVTAAVVSGSHVDPRAGAVTCRAYCAEWLARQVWAPGTVAAMELAARSATFADLPMRSIRPSHVQVWVKAMTATGLAPGTVAMRFRYVRGAFRAAHRDKVIATDPTEGITLPRTRRAEAAMRIPTPEQVGQIMAAAEEWFRPLIGLCAFGGCRLGEAAAVKLDDVNFLKRTLTVSRQVQRAGGGQIRICAPKCESERVVYLPDGLLAMLAAYVERIGVRPNGWLFVGPGGGPPNQNTVGSQWRRTLRAAGLSGIRLHDLRHYYASGLIAEGCDVVTVQRALGHSSASVTLGVYSHLWPSAEDRTRRAAGAMMNAALADSADSVRTPGAGKGPELRK